MPNDRCPMTDAQMTYDGCPIPDTHPAIYQTPELPVSLTVLPCPYTRRLDSQCPSLSHHVHAANGWTPSVPHCLALSIYPTAGLPVSLTVPACPYIQCLDSQCPSLSRQVHIPDSWTPSVPHCATMSIDPMPELSVSLPLPPCPYVTRLDS